MNKQNLRDVVCFFKSSNQQIQANQATKNLVSLKVNGHVPFLCQPDAVCLSIQLASYFKTILPETLAMSQMEFVD